MMQLRYVYVYVYEYYSKILLRVLAIQYLILHNKHSGATSARNTISRFAKIGGSLSHV